MDDSPLAAFPKTHLEKFRGPGCTKKCRYLVHRLHFCMCVNTYQLIGGCAWNWKPLMWLIYRSIIALISSTLLIYIFVGHTVFFKGDVTKTFKFFIYLTNWSFILLAVTAVIWTITLTIAYFASKKPFSGEILDDEQQEHAERLSPLFILLWVLININTTTALGVTFGFWLVVYKPGVTTISPSTIFSHVVNSVLVLADVLLSSVPFRIAHFYQPLAFGLVYLGFTLVYYASKGTNPFGNIAIYPTLNWDYPLVTLQFSLLGGVFIVFILHGLVCFLSLVRGYCVVYCLHRKTRKIEVHS